MFTILSLAENKAEIKHWVIGAGADLQSTRKTHAKLEPTAVPDPNHRRGGSAVNVDHRTLRWVPRFKSAQNKSVRDLRAIKSVNLACTNSYIFPTTDKNDA